MLTTMRRGSSLHSVLIVILCAILLLTLAAGVVLFLFLSAADHSLEAPPAEPEETLQIRPVPVQESPALDPGEVARLEQRIAELEREKSSLAAQVAELEAERSGETSDAPPADEDEGPTLHQIEQARDALASAIDGDGMMKRFGTAEFQDQLAEVMSVLGPEGKETILASLASEDTQARMMAALLLEGLNDPTTVAALEVAGTTDEDVLVRRFASHALAMIHGDEQIPTLERIADQEDQDWGARINAAYGLARRGEDRWMTFMIDKFESGAVSPDLQLAVLGGILDAADDVSPEVVLPFVNGLVASPDSSESKLWGGLSALGKMGDRSSLPALEELVASEKPEALKQLAREAINRIEGYPRYPDR